MFLLLYAASLAGYRYNTSHLVLDWNLADAGQTYNSAVSALEGKVPYRDFNYQWGPYALYLNVLVFKVLGIKISSVRLLLTVTVILITSLTFLLGRRFLPSLYAFLSAFIVHITLLQNTLVPYANIYCIATGLASLYLSVEYCRTRKNYLVSMAGLLCGVSLGLKFSAGLYITAGTIMALLVADGQYQAWAHRVSGKLKFPLAATLISAFLVANAIFLIRAHLNVKYFTLFIVPILIACFGVLKVQGQFEAGAPLEESRQRFWKSLLRLGVGVFAGSLPWTGFYLAIFNPARFFHHVIGSAIEHSKHIFLPYPEAEETTVHLAGYALCLILGVWLAKMRGYTKYIWIMVLAFAAACMWTLRIYFRPAEWLSIITITNNITFFLSPAVAILSSLVAISSLNAKAKARNILETDARILPVVSYQVFFFLVAYPHTEFTHLSWSCPTTMILLFFLLERVRILVVQGWPSHMRKSLGRAAGWTLTLSLPALIILAKLFPLFAAFYRVSPDLTHWVPKEYVKLEGERGGVYEFVESAEQIEAVDRFIQANTSEGDYLFEFPTTFFYYYSQRKNPSKWDYFYPGLNSDKQGEIIRELEEKEPRFAIMYDNPYGWMFTYSKITKSYPKLGHYISRNYDTAQQIGYFKIMRRKLPKKRLKGNEDILS